jgi:hypothetical protein
LGEDIDFASHVLINKCQWNNPAAYFDEFANALIALTGGDSARSTVNN